MTDIYSAGPSTIREASVEKFPMVAGVAFSGAVVHLCYKVVNAVVKNIDTDSWHIREQARGIMHKNMQQETRREPKHDFDQTLHQNTGGVHHINRDPGSRVPEMQDRPVSTAELKAKVERVCKALKDAGGIATKQDLKEQSARDCEALVQEAHRRFVEGVRVPRAGIQDPSGAEKQSTVNSATDFETKKPPSPLESVQDEATIDLDYEPYTVIGAIPAGSIECKLCLTLHSDDASFLAHSHGRKHRSMLARRAVKEGKKDLEHVSSFSKIASQADSDAIKPSPEPPSVVKETKDDLAADFEKVEHPDALERERREARENLNRAYANMVEVHRSMAPPSGPSML